MLLRTITLLLLVVSGFQVEAAEPPAPPASPQFIGVLRLVPRLYEDKAWTEKENAVIGRHFQRLQQDAAQGKVILAGRTLEPGAVTFGIVVFTAASLADARSYVAADPAVAEGLMTAEVHPYAVAVLGRPPPAKTKQD